MQQDKYMNMRKIIIHTNVLNPCTKSVHLIKTKGIENMTNEAASKNEAVKEIESSSPTLAPAPAPTEYNMLLNNVFALDKDGAVKSSILITDQITDVSIIYNIDTNTFENKEGINLKYIKDQFKRLEVITIDSKAFKPDKELLKFAVEANKPAQSFKIDDSPSLDSIRPILKFIDANTGLLKDKVSDMFTYINSLFGTPSFSIEAVLNKYAFNKHLLIISTAGEGKTFNVDKFADDSKCKKIFSSLHNGTESIDLLGMLIPTKSGDLIWKDGPLTEAFRAAKTEKVILIMDELLRARADELNIFIGSLTPNSKGQYVLNTGRIIDEKDGIAREEVLKIPVENFWTIAMSNYGSDYNVSTIDGAFLDRFRVIPYSMPEDIKKGIIKDMFSGIDGMEILQVNQTMALFKASATLSVKGYTKSHINLRNISECASMADDFDDYIGLLYDVIPNKININGDCTPDKEQYAYLKEVINSSYGISGE